MHAFRSYIFAARIACDSGPSCTLCTDLQYYTDYQRKQQNCKVHICILLFSLISQAHQSVSVQTVTVRFVIVQSVIVYFCIDQ